MTSFPSVIPRLIIELREDDHVAAIVGQRIRSPHPGPDDAKWAALEDGSRKYAHNFIVLVQLDAPRHLSLPVQFAVIDVACYGVDRRTATELRWAASNALHRKGPRVHANGLGIYQSNEEAGGGQESDPDTGQPVERVIIRAIATTLVVT